jgi:putative membrane protein
VNVAHQADPHGDLVGVVLPVLALSVTAGIYLLLAAQATRDARGWNPWRTAGFMTGLALLAVALVPDLGETASAGFRGHMAQHLLIAMLAPIGLVLGAPVTLMLRSLPLRQARAVGRLLRSRPAHLLGNPIAALLLNLGGLYALYFTPLYAATTTNDLLHHGVHLHFLLAGYLFAWVVAGPDPAPRRPSVPFRLVVLGTAIVAHAGLSQLMYAGMLVQVPVPADELRAGAEMMYYGGDVAELILALAMVSTWRPRRPPRGILGSGPATVAQTAGSSRIDRRVRLPVEIRETRPTTRASVRSRS